MKTRLPVDHWVFIGREDPRQQGQKSRWYGFARLDVKDMSREGRFYVCKLDA